MHLIPLLSVAIAAVVLYALNRRVQGLPPTIGVTVWALGASLALVAAGALGSPVHDFARRLVAHVNFRETLLDGGGQALVQERRSRPRLGVDVGGRV